MASFISSLRFTSSGKASFQTARSKAVAVISIIKVPSTLRRPMWVWPYPRLSTKYFLFAGVQWIPGSWEFCTSAKQACWNAKFGIGSLSLLFKYWYRAIVQDLHTHTSPSTGKERIWACLSFFVIQISMRYSEFSVGCHLCNTSAFHFPWEFVVCSWNVCCLCHGMQTLAKHIGSHIRLWNAHLDIVGLHLLNVLH